MTEFVIREANDADGPALLAVLTQAWADGRGVVFDAADQPPLHSPGETFTERAGRLWVAVRGEAVVAALGVLPAERAGDFALSLVAVETSARGQGLAAAMLAGADAFAQASGAERLIAWIDTRLVDGMRFLERHGFVRDPGVKSRHEHSDALEAHFARPIGLGVGEPLSSPPSEARPTGDA